MNTKLILAATLMTATVSAETYRLENLQFQVPAGWQVMQSDNGAAIMPPNAVAGSEGYRVTVLHAGTDPRAEMSRFTPVAAPARFSAAGGPGTVYRYELSENGHTARVELYLVTLKSGKMGTVAAMGLPALISQRATALMSLASSLSETPAAPPASAPAVTSGGSAVTQQWMARLSGHRLMQFNTYSSGMSGGMSSQRTLALAADGSYSFRKSSSVSMYVPGATGTSAGQNGSDGRWRIYEENGRAILELVSPTAGREAIELSSQGTKTFLNGRRWLVE